MPYCAWLLVLFEVIGNHVTPTPRIENNNFFFIMFKTKLCWILIDLFVVWLLSLAVFNKAHLGKQTIHIWTPLQFREIHCFTRSNIFAPLRWNRLKQDLTQDPLGWFLSFNESTLLLLHLNVVWSEWIVACFLSPIAAFKCAYFWFIPVLLYIVGKIAIIMY